MMLVPKLKPLVGGRNSKSKPNSKTRIPATGYMAAPRKRGAGVFTVRLESLHTWWSGFCFGQLITFMSWLPQDSDRAGIRSITGVDAVLTLQRCVNHTTELSSNDSCPPQPVNRVAGYFNETPSERQSRQQEAKADRNAKFLAEITQAAAEQDWDTVLDRCEFIVKYWARLAARWYRLSETDVDDLCQIGRIQVFHAARVYDPNRGATLSTYISSRVKGHVLNDARRLKRFKRWSVVGVSTNDAIDDDLRQVAPPACEDEGFESVDTSDAMDFILGLVGRLHERYASIIEQRLSGLRFHEIGVLHDLSTARVSQLFVQAVEQLQKHAFTAINGVSPIHCETVRQQVNAELHRIRVQAERDEEARRQERLEHERLQREQRRALKREKERERRHAEKMAAIEVPEFSIWSWRSFAKAG